MIEKKNELHFSIKQFIAINLIVIEKNNAETIIINNIKIVDIEIVTTLIKNDLRYSMIIKCFS